MDSPPTTIGNGIAIVGMAGRFPGAGDIERFWENLVAGVESITFFSAAQLLAAGVAPERIADPAFVPARAVVAGCELFDAALFGFTPREAEVIDPQHRLLLECAWEALERAGYAPHRFAGPIGVFAGAGINTYLLSNLQHNPEVMAAVGSYQAMLASGADFLATRLSYKLGLRGPSLTVQTACSTSLVAVHLAVQSLLSNECDLALAGGVRLLAPRHGGHTYEAGGIFSPDGHCRPFDASAAGTVDGEGVGLVVLKRLAEAVADGDTIAAVILGSAINNDGSGKLGYTAPSVDGQADVMAVAQALAGIEADAVGLVEAHGTGTQLGDPIEFAALARVFAGVAPGRCALTSLKGNMGHLDAAAGIAALIKAALAIERGVIPPAVHFARPNPQIDLASSAFYVPVEAAAWPAPGPRLAGVSSFGIGGTNAHAVLGEAPAAAPGSPSRRLQLLVLSARSTKALEQTTHQLAEHLARHPELELADVAHTLAVGRSELDHRRCVVAESTADAVQVLGALDPKRVLTRVRDAGSRQVFFLFPGQGSQRPGMAAELYASEPLFRDEVDRGAELLRPHLGLDLREALYPAADHAGAAAARLEQTALAQPALFVVEHALARLWMSWGIRPQAMLGHSVGEYVAACLAGVFAFEDALRLVAERGRLMQQMPGGAMLAVPLSEAEVQPLLGRLSLAAVNGPAMCVVSGESGEIEELAARLAERGLEARRLHTSHAFHSAAMEPVLPPFAAAFANLRLGSPAIPFVSNLTGTWIRPEEATSPRYWVRHLRETVRLSAGLDTLFARPSAVFLEVGPGQALTTVVRQHPQRPSAPSVLASLPAAAAAGAAADLGPAGGPRAAGAALLRTLGQLWLAGASVDWAGFYAHERRRRVPLPTYPFDRQRYWVEPSTPAPEVRGRAASSRGAAAGELASWFWAPLWHQALPPVEGAVVAGEAAESWLVFADEAGLGEGLAARLRERGRAVTMVRAGDRFVESAGGDFALRPGEAADYAALLDRLSRRGRSPARIVHLWSVGAARPAGEELERGFHSLWLLARALGDGRPAGRQPPLHLGVVTTGVQRVTHGDRLVPVRATSLGPAVVLPQEYPGISCAAIDVDLPPAGSRQGRQLLDLLAAELANPEAGVVAYRGADRWLRVFEPLPLPRSRGPLPLREGGTYLITGGLGGVGLELAGFLVRQAKVKLVLSGRSSFPSREAWPALARGGDRRAPLCRRLCELEAAGGEVSVVAADVTDAAAMRRLLAEVRQRSGRIDGVIHAAGVPGGGLMQVRTPEAAAAVLAPKVLGTQVLAELLAEEPPDFLVLCSSLTALAGGPGQFDYAAANAFLDAFAQSMSGELPVVAINWDSWRGVGMSLTARRQAGAGEPDAEDPQVMELEPFAHPLLRERGVAGDNAGVFVARLSPSETWVLDEHRLGGYPLVPGTAYLEMAGAAYRGLAGTDGAIELRDVQFVTPLQVDDGETRELQVVLHSNGNGFHGFSARSRTGDGWQQHVTGEVGRAADEEPLRLDVSSFAGWSEEVLGEDYREDLKQSGLGPRWEGLRKIYRRDDELVGVIELSPELAGDVQDFALHPAMLDAATSFAERYVPGAAGQYYLPLAYKRLRMLGPLPPRIYSHTRLRAQEARETLSFDLTMVDETGLERVRIESFTLKRVDVGATLRGRTARGGAKAPAVVETEASMPPAQAVEAFGWILAGNQLPQVAVSVQPLPEVLARSRATTAEQLAEELAAAAGVHPRPELETAYVAPRGELEARIAAIWGNLLGIDRVGVFDDFFELGGHSLLGTRLMSRVREALGVEVPLGKLFEAATVAELGAVVERLRQQQELTPAGQVAQQRIPRRAASGPAPLSFAQQRLWFLEQLQPGLTGYNLPLGIRISGRLHGETLAVALREVVRRHAALRTVFRAADGEPVQVVLPLEQLLLPRLDLVALSAAVAEREARRVFVEDDVEVPFDLVKGPLFRPRLLRLGPQDHILLLTTHHIVSDAWSHAVLMRELVTLYEAFGSGRRSPLPGLPIQYADFAAWERGRLSGAGPEEESAYARRLERAPSILELPADHLRPAVQTARGASAYFRIGPGLAGQVAALSRRQGATLFMTLLASWAVWLGRAARQDDLTIGTPVAGRNQPETEDLIGFFVNSLALRLDLSGDPTFAELQARVREVALEAYAQADLPFERLVSRLQPERFLSHNPLFQVMFALQNVPLERLSVAGLTLEPLELPEPTAQFDLGLTLTEVKDRLDGHLRWSADLFDPPTAHRMIGHLQTLLAAAVADSGLPISGLPLLTPAERHQTVVEWNDSAAGEALAGGAADVMELFAAQVVRAPAAVALTCGSESLSFADLDRRADRLARRLRAAGVGPGMTVGLYLERSAELVVGLLAIWKAGGAYLPLDPALPRPRLAFLLDDSAAPFVLTGEELAATFPPCSARVLRLDALVGDAEAGEAGGEAGGAGEGGAPPPRALPGDLAYRIYTSGTTGRPKAVEVERGSLAAVLAATRRLFRFAPGDRMPCVAPFSFDIFLFELLSPLLAGGTSVLSSRGPTLDVEWLAAEAGEATRLHAVPALMRQVVDAVRRAPRAAAGQSLRTIFVGGDTVPAELLEDLRETFPRARVWVLYGPTEATILCTAHPVPPAGKGTALPLLGRPLSGAVLHLCDAAGQPVPIGVPGEIWIGGRGVSRGYWRREALTAEKFVDRGGSRFFRTGDLARRRPDGALEFLGRIDQQVKVRGFRIELGEIESVLARHPAVSEAVVAPAGAFPPTADKRLAAYVVPRSGPALGLVPELLRFLRNELPEYMVPSHLVLLESLPLTTHGKVDRAALPEPARDRAGVEEDLVAPRTPTEEAVARIWAELLDLPAVGVLDNFFALGGHSLLATQVVSRLRQSFGVALPVRTLFEQPTVAALAASVTAELRRGTAAALPPIRPVGRDQPLPLSFAQQRLWFIAQLEPGSPVYNVPAAVRLTGPLDRAALAAGFDEVLARHEVLRTTFGDPPQSGGAFPGEPVQRIAPPGTWPLPGLDLRGLPAARRESEARRAAGLDSGRPFDLERGPLARTLLLRLEDDDHWLVLTVHHIVFDGWSAGVLIRELASLYAPSAAGEPRRLPPLRSLPPLQVQYADFAWWQRLWLTGEALEREMAYWREQLAPAPQLLELPTDRPRPLVQRHRGGSRELRLPAALAAELRALARRQDATLFMTLLAGFHALLTRCSGQLESSVGAPVAGRNHPEIENLIGCFVNTLVLRASLRPDFTFVDLLAQTRETSLAALAHQELPFERLVEQLAPARSRSHAPLFQVMFVLQHAAAGTPESGAMAGVGGGLRIGGLTFSRLPVASRTAKFDLTLVVEETSRDLAATLEYDRDLFDAATVDLLAASFRTLLAAAAGAPGKRLAELPLLGPVERQQLLVEWNATSAPGVPLTATLAELFAAQAARTPEAVAVTCGGQAVTYGELAVRAWRWARRLRRAGVGPEVVVGLCVERSPEMVLGLLAVLAAGGAYLPLDPAHPPARLAHLIEHARPGALLTRRDLRPRLPEAGGVPVLELDGQWEDGALLEPGEPEEPGQPASADNLAYVLYTSGSTGMPKGVMVPHRGVVNHLSWAAAAFGVNEGSAAAVSSPLGFDLTVTSLLVPLVSGGRVELLPEERGVEALAGALRAGVCNLFKLTPSHLAALAEVLAETDLSERSGLMVVGGEVLEGELVEWWRRRAPGLRVVNEYGPTETVVGCCTHLVKDGEPSAGPVPIGRPIANARLYLLDARQQPVPRWAPGDLYVGGPGVSRGYLGRPDLTAERFVPNPFGESPGDRLYHTGDRVRLRPDGEAEFLGRSDHQVKIRGFRIEPGEVEAVLASHPGVREAAVVAQGQGADLRLVAFAIGEADAAGLRRFVEEKLPAYMVPAAFILLDALPLSGNGKVDRRALAELGVAEAHTAPTQAPRTRVEKLMAGLWAQLLGPQAPGIDDDFFALGGHSLLAVQLVSRIRKVLGVGLAVETVFDSPTIRGLAAAVEAQLATGGRAEAAPIRARLRTERPVLSFAQRRLWFLHQLDVGSPAYNIPAALELAGELDRAALAAALGEVVARHEVLRTTFVEVAGETEPLPRVAEPAAWTLPLVDLSRMPLPGRAALVRRIGAAEAQRPFDLARGPLVRAFLLRLSGREHVLLLNLHHIVFDGWSVDVLTRELAALYGAASAQRPSPLPPLSMQYADFAAWQRQWLAGDRLESQLRTWRVRLQGAPAVLDLPLSRPRPPVRRLRGAQLPFALPDESVLALARPQREGGATLFMVLLSGFMALLSRLTGQEDLVVGAPVAGRNRLETEDLIGFFVNMVVLRADVSGDPSFLELLGRVRQVTLEAFAHQDLPFEKLVDELQTERTLAHSPLFQVVLALQEPAGGALELPGLRLTPLDVPVDGTKFDLTVGLTRTAAGLDGAWEYDRDLFDAAAVRRFQGQFRELLLAAAANPAARLSQLPWLSAAERHQLLWEWNAARESWASELGLYELFSAAARRCPEAVAVSSGQECLTYGDLERRSAALAERLRALGVGPEVPVALCLARSAELVVAVLGVLAAGGAYVPIDPDYPRERQGFILADSGAPILLTERRFAPGFEQLAQGRLRLLLLDGAATGASAPEAGAGRPGGGVGGGNLAYVIYTSGSTGRPKGVLVEHGNAVRLFAATQPWFRCDGRDVWTLFHSYAFDFSVWEMWGALLYGGRLVVVPYWVSRSPEAFCHLLEQEQVTVLSQTPSAFGQLVAAAGAAGDHPLDSLRLVIFGGEALELAALGRWWNGHSAERPRLVNMYGITETTVHVTYRPVVPADLGRPGSPIGLAIPDLGLSVLDSRQRAVAIGVAGELCVGGAGVARGYLGRPELTASRFVPDPFGERPGARLYRSGDLVRYREDGDLEHLGRIDHQVKVRGFRIELGEIEAALEAHPGVAEAVVAVRPQPGGGRQLVAYVVPVHPGLTAVALRQFLRERQPEPMVPSAFVLLERLPLTAHGKVDREALPAAPATPPTLTIGEDGEQAPPPTDLERQLAEVWAELLGAARVGVDDNFFDLGGDSMQAVRLAGLIKERLGRAVRVQDVFKHQTVSAMAAQWATGAAGRSHEQERAAGLAAIERFQGAVLGDEMQRAKLPAGCEDFFPLSATEKGMIYYSLLLPEQPIYHDQFVHTLSIPDVDTFFHAFELVAGRHPILRSTFHLYGFAEPLKVVHARLPLRPDVEDLGTLPRAAQRQRIESYGAEDLGQRFSFEGGLLWRLKLFGLGGGFWCVAFTVHHAMLDGWSNMALWLELNNLCARPDLAAVTALAPLASTYKDHLAITLGRERSAATEAFWRETLAGHERNRLPFQRARTGSEAGGMDVCDARPEAGLLADLRARAAELHVPLKALCLAAHVHLLHVLTGEVDVVTGVVSHDRPGLPDGDRILGCFLNSIPVRMRMRGGESGAALARRVGSYLMISREHEIPLVDIAALVGGRGTAENPIFDVLFNFMDFHLLTGLRDNVLFQAMADPGQDEPLAVRGNEMTNTLLDLEVSTTLDALEVRIKFSPRHFTPGDVEQALGLYLGILNALARQPEAPLGSEMLLAASEREGLVRVFNATARPRPPRLLHAGFAEQAARRPEAPAVLCGGRTLGYGELAGQANRLARRLLAAGVVPGENVGLVLPRSEQLVAALLAVLAAGAAYVPMEPDYPAARKAHIVRQSGVRRVLADRIYDLAGEVEAEWLVPAAADLARVSGSPLPVLALPPQLAYTIYTSGSTGLPKGVMIEHASAANLIDWVNEEYGIGPGQRVLMVSSVCFDLSVYDVFGALAAGAAVVVARAEEVREPSLLWRLVREQGVTFWNSVPSTLGLLVEYLEESAPAVRCESLRLIFLSGDWIPVGLPERARRFFPHARVVGLGGATEAAVWSVYHPIEAVDPTLASVPYGRPLANNTGYLLDGNLELVPPGVVGDLYIGGMGVARGYAADPAKTAAAFVPDPLAGDPGARLYRTGDLGRMLPGGELEFLGRRDHQVKVRGFRIELGEIESQLCRHPSVQEAAVTARTDRSGQKFLCAYVVAAAMPAAQELKAHLERALPGYMVPDVYVGLAKLPLTANGKVDRKALPEPELANLDPASAYAAPAGELESALARIWEEVLGVERIGVRHDFFALGGHSLSAVQVITRIRHLLGVELPLRSLFDNPTVAGLAAAVGALGGGGAASGAAPSQAVAPPGNRPRPAQLPLSFAQQRMWVLHQLNPRSAAFNLPLVLRLSGGLDQPALAASVSEIRRRHESLRTTFPQIGGGPVQVIAPLRPHLLSRVDLGSLAPERREPTARRLVEEEVARPFDLGRGPLLRTSLLRLSATEHVGVFNLHHIVADGWSLGLLSDEIATLYAARVRRLPSPLPEPRVQYADYTLWQREWLAGDRLELQLAYWRARLAGELPVLRLPMLRRRPARQSFRAEQEGFSLAADVSDALRQLAGREGVTIFVLLLAALKVLLRLYSGQDDLVVGTVTANRSSFELERLIGFFVNTLALRTDLSGDPSFRQVVTRVRDTAFAAFEHQDVPYERVLEELEPQRAGKQVFQFMFQVLNYDGGARELPGLTLTPFELPVEKAQDYLSLTVAGGEGEIQGWFTYSTDFFEAVTIRRIARQLEELLACLIADPDRRLSSLSALDEAAAGQLIAAFNEDV
jgi:amino acid adenylation domain-containing protein